MTTIRLQTEFLRMTWAGIPDAPADPSDPHDVEGPGIHLRWSFPTRWVAGVPMPLGWPTAGFTLLRRDAVPPVDDVTLDLPGAPDIRPDATLALGAGMWLEFDPDLLVRTLRNVPRAATDTDVLLDAYPGYVTVRFPSAVRRVRLVIGTRPLNGPGPRLAVLRAHDRGDVVDEAVLIGSGPTDPTLTVTGDHLTSVRFRLDGTRIGSITIASAEALTETKDWEEVATLPPLVEWKDVRARIPEQFWSRCEEGWGAVKEDLARLLDPTDARPRWARTYTEAGSVQGRSPKAGEVMPTWTYGLQEQLLLFSVDPFLARLLGLLYADTSAEAATGAAVDYLVLATFPVPDANEPGPVRLPAAPLDGPSTDPDPVPVPDGTVGWVCYGASSRRGRQVPPPDRPTAGATPGATFLPDPGTGILTRLAHIGVSWPLLPEGAGGPLDAGAVRFDVEARTEGVTGWSLLTGEAPLVVAGSVDELGAVTPPTHLFVDSRPAGRHAYRVRGIDVFGRRSAPSEPVTVRIADTVGPPPPVDVWVRWLDPADPFLAADEQELGQGLLVRFAYPHLPYLAGTDATDFLVHAVTGARDRAEDQHDPAIWGAPIGRLPHASHREGEVTAVVIIEGEDPAIRRANVTTTIAASDVAVGGAGTGTRWSLRRGHLRVGGQEFRVAATDATAAAVTFTLAWPTALGLPDPAAGPCTWYPGYQAFLPGYAPTVGPAGMVTGAVALGALDADGNAGRLSGEAAFQRVDRSAPAAAGAFTLGAEQLLASTPDAHGRSRFEVTWQPAAGVAGHHVLRALDTAILVRHGLDPTLAQDLEPGALLGLAQDPVAEPAYSQITTEAVVGEQWVDETLEGFGTNRYVYRLCPVSPAGARGALGPCSPPVATPDVVPPRPPAGVKATGGDGTVHVRFVTGRERDVDHYVLYRTADRDASDDRRAMHRVGELLHSPSAPTMTFEDDATGSSPPPVATDLWYRVSAVDRSGNESVASRAVVARCWSTAAPSVPTPTVRRAAGGSRCAVGWAAPEPGVAVLVQRQAVGSSSWRPASGWLTGTRQFLDTGLDPAVPLAYRLLGRSPWRTVAASETVTAEEQG